MPAKSKKSNKKTSGSSPWLPSFGGENDSPDSLLEVLKEHDITCEEIVVGLSERDIADQEPSVGHRVLLRRAIAALASDEAAAASGRLRWSRKNPSRQPCLLTWHKNSRPLRPFLAGMSRKIRTRSQYPRLLRLLRRKLQPEVSSCSLVNVSMAQMGSS